MNIKWRCFKIINLHKVKIQNFMSFRDEEVELNERGLVLIEGFNQTGDNFSSNGSGKSTIMNSITYALYGRVGYPVKADDVVNNTVGKDTCVTLEFDKDGIEYRIERYRKHKDHKNKVLLFENGNEITQKSARDTNALIIEIIEMDYDTYTNSIMYGQGDSIVFSQATDKEKKEILEDITNIAVYNKAQEVAKEKVKEEELNLSENERQQETLNHEINTLTALADQAKENYQQTERQIKEKESELSNAKYTLEQFNYEERKEEIRQEYEANRTAYQQDITTLQAELDGILQEEEEPSFTYDDTELQQIEEVASKLQEAKNQLDMQKSNIRNDIARYKTEQTQLNTAENCPTCGQPLDASHAKAEHQRLANAIQEAEQKLDGVDTYLANKVLPMIEDNDTARESFLNAKEQAREAHNQKYRNNNKRAMELTNETNEMKRKLDNLHTNEEHEYQSLRTELDNQKNNIERLEQELDQLNTIPKPDLKEEEIKEKQDKLEKIKDENNVIFIAKEQYEDAVKVFSNKGVRSMVLDLVTPFLNKQANKYLNKLTGSTIEVNFTTQVENQDGTLADRFDVEVNNTSGGETYLLNSEGEKKRIDLAISFALQDLVSTGSEGMNIALYDEIFESLDQVGSENVVDILEEKVKEIGTIFVITHNEHLKPLFENIMTVVKENGESKIMRESMRT